MTEAASHRTITVENTGVDLLTTIIEPTSGWAALQLGAIWRYRGLLYFLIWRDLKVRYKQTALGVLWIVLQPLAATLIFTVVFGRLAKISTDETPYAVFAYAGLLPWNYFAGAVNRSGTSLVGNAHLVTKVYFPRLIIPISTTLAGLIDFSVSFLVFLVVTLAYRTIPGVNVLFMPLFLALAVITALGVGAWLAALNVRYRDVTQVLPVMIQLWLYASPIVYPTTLIPERWHPLYALNPMVGVVDGFRWALTGGGAFPAISTAIAVLVALLVTTTGIVYFRYTERTFADIV